MEVLGVVWCQYQKMWLPQLKVRTTQVLNANDLTKSAVYTTQHTNAGLAYVMAKGYPMIRGDLCQEDSWKPTHIIHAQVVEAVQTQKLT